MEPRVSRNVTLETHLLVVQVVRDFMHEFQPLRWQRAQFAS